MLRGPAGQPALFRWPLCRPARTLRSGLFRIHDQTWRTSTPAPSAAPSWPRSAGAVTSRPSRPWPRSFVLKGGPVGDDNGRSAAASPPARVSGCDRTSSSRLAGSRRSSTAASGMAVRSTGRVRGVMPPSGRLSSGVIRPGTAAMRGAWGVPDGRSCGYGSTSSSRRYVRRCSPNYVTSSPGHEKARPGGRADRKA